MVGLGGVCNDTPTVAKSGGRNHRWTFGQKQLQENGERHTKGRQGQ